MTTDLPIESHPWEPWLPADTRVLILGTFPPGVHRHAMDFYYPNPINDFWKIMGLIFSGNPNMLYNPADKSYDLPAIKRLTEEAGIGLSDTVRRARRLAGNAADKSLDVVEALDLQAVLDRIPGCTDIATTGMKAAEIVAAQTGSPIPAMGRFVEVEVRGRAIRVWRMPSTSRAYPLKIDKKAAFYAALLREAGVVR